MTVSEQIRACGARFDDAPGGYDALLVLSFGGPEGMEDVIPFLENVTRGRGVPPERLEEVAEHYRHFGGVSPINAQNRALIEALRIELAGAGHDLPIYFGNRNWTPYVIDTVRQMRDDGVRKALLFVTSAFSSYSGCRQYLEDIERAVKAVGEGAPSFDKLRVFFNHPGFIEPMVERIREALYRFPEERRHRVDVVFTAHSIPLTMAQTSAYEAQLHEAVKLVAEGAGVVNARLAYQSRSGAPHIPWLEPDILDVLDSLHADGKHDVIVCPIGFISDHLEVLFDLDEEGAGHAAGLGMTYVRAGTAGTHPRFVAMIRELIEERMQIDPLRLALGNLPAGHDRCAANCCVIARTGNPQHTL